MPAGLLPGTEGIICSLCVFPPISVNGGFVVKSKYLKGGQYVVTEACLVIFFVPKPMIYDPELKPTLLQK